MRMTSKTVIIAGIDFPLGERAMNDASQEKGGATTDYAKAIRHFRRLMKLRS
jgi:hypothetical protein